MDWTGNTELDRAINRIIVAILMALLSLLGYDEMIAKPRLRRMARRQRARQSAGSRGRGAASGSKT